MTTRFEMKVKSGKTSSDECLMCDKTLDKEDTFLTGFQDPHTKRVSLIRLCRICLVVNVTPELKSFIYKQWDAK